MTGPPSPPPWTKSPPPFSPARLAAIAAAESSGHEKITPRDPDATLEDLTAWCRSRYSLAVLEGIPDLTRAIEIYAAEIGAPLPVVR